MNNAIQENEANRQKQRKNNSYQNKKRLMEEWQKLLEKYDLRKHFGNQNETTWNFRILKTLKTVHGPIIHWTSYMSLLEKMVAVTYGLSAVVHGEDICGTKIDMKRYHDSFILCDEWIHENVVVWNGKDEGNIEMDWRITDIVSLQEICKYGVYCELKNIELKYKQCKQ